MHSNLKSSHSVNVNPKHVSSAPHLPPVGIVDLVIRVITTRQQRELVCLAFGFEGEAMEYKTAGLPDYVLNKLIRVNSLLHATCCS